MRKLILLAATASMAVPSAAMAQHYNRNHHHSRTEVRHDRHGRHDRQRARTHHRVVYVAPVRNWRYRPVSVGYRLQSIYYQPRYYITDYGMYGVRAPSRWDRWIRYGDDLLLVNIRTGRVLQVIHYRYW